MTVRIETINHYFCDICKKECADHTPTELVLSRTHLGVSIRFYAREDERSLLGDVCLSCARAACLSFLEETKQQSKM